MSTPCNDFLYPLFPQLAYEDFTATVSKALKPNNIIHIHFPLPSAMREENYFRVVEKHNGKYGSTT